MAPVPSSGGSYRSLDPSKLIQTIEQLQNRINERFPDSGQSRVVAELLKISRDAVDRAHWIARPNIPLRIGIGLLVALIITVFVTAVLSVHASFSFSNFSDFMQAVDASFNVIVLTGAAIAFLATLEVRIKRSKALKMLHELRALAHIVDIHQLTKDPERIANPGKDTASSPSRKMTVFELSRYLDYCSEMLSLIGKIAALYAQYSEDVVVLEAVDDIEDLTTGLSRKIWQKIMIANQTAAGPC